MNNLPEFHTFYEACECIEAGGMARRYGSAYPYYHKETGGFGFVVRVRYGGSGGDLWDRPIGSSDGWDGFTVDEQQSTDWVLTSPEDWAASQERTMEFYRQQSEKRHQEWTDKHSKIIPDRGWRRWLAIWGSL